MAVRHERVVLDLEDRFTAGMARAAAAATVLDKNLGHLGGTSRSTSQDVDRVGESTERTSKSTRSGASELDKYSGRLSVLRDTAVLLGPAIAPIAAVAVPAVAGLAAQFGAAALAGGTALLAFQGVGDALKAVNTAALEPTTENLAKAQQALEQLSPAAQDFVGQLESLQPVLKGLEGSAASGLFPGLGAALAELSTAAPQVEQVLGSIGTVLGNLSKQGADALTGDSFRGFFAYIQHDAPVALAQMGAAVGHVTHALAELLQATAPLQRDFGSGLVSAAAAFDRFATGVSKTQGFEEFIAFVQQSGPQVAHAVGSIANALLQVVEASSGFGGPVLAAVSAVADVVAKLADSSAGPAIIGTASALALLNRAMATSSAISGSSLAKNIGAAKTAATAAEGFGGKLLAVTKTLGPWGLAVGAGAGLLLEFAHSQQQSAADVSALSATLDAQTGAVTENTRSFVANQLQQQGVLDAAQTLGLNLKTVTDAALGNADAQRQVDSATSGLKGTYTGLGYAADLVSKAVGAQSGAVADARSGTKQLAEANYGAAGSFDQAISAAQTFSQQLASLNDALQGRASMRDYEASIDDFAKSLKDNGKSLDINTEKGRANQAALDNIAATAGKVASTLQGADRANFLVKARASFLDAARKAGLTQQAARGLANQLADTGNISVKPKVLLDAANADRGLANLHQDLATLDRSTANPKVDVNAGNALSVLHQVSAELFGLHDKTVTLTTNHVVHNIGVTGNPQARAAAGGTVSKSGPRSADLPIYLEDCA